MSCSRVIISDPEITTGGQVDEHTVVVEKSHSVSSEGPLDTQEASFSILIRPSMTSAGQERLCRACLARLEWN